jgi:GNAT superfamily N-acetyltransferase
LSLIAVAPEHRRQGVARDLVVHALQEAGGLRIDLVTDTAEEFYSALPHFRLGGYRLFPEYTGQDRHRPEIYWRAGRKSDR